MDYCEGGTLRSLMVDDIAIPLAQSIRLVADVLRGLACAHQQGIVHCDIKPENILLTMQAKGWMAKISDFGIARLNQEVYSQSTGNTGSPAYMAPERFYSQYSAASDIYAVGILLFELLVGRRPFTGTPKALMAAHLNESVVCPNEIPAGLQGVINTALQKLPARRFQSALEMLDSIESVVDRIEGLGGQISNIAEPLLILRQEIPYYDSTPQVKEGARYVVESFDGLQPGNVSPGKTASNGHAPHLCHPSHLGYIGTTNFTYRAIAPSHPTGAASPDAPSPELPANTPSTGRITEQSFLKDASLGWRSLRLPEPIQQLLPAPQGYFLTTRSTIYWVDTTGGSGVQSLTGSDAPLELETLTAQPIYELEQDCIAAIEPSGHWLALITDFRQMQQQAGGFSTLSFHPLPRRPRPMALPQSSIRLRVAGRAKKLLKAIALDRRHVAIISDGPHPKAKQKKKKAPESSQAASSSLLHPNPIPDTMSRATYIEVFTRRGQRIALQYLPMCLGQIITTPEPYRLLATDQYDPTSVLCIDLKPFRIQRFVLDIKPQFLAATDWGYIVADKQGNIIFLDTSGYAVSALHGPSHLTAMTFLAPQWLFLSTWKDDKGFLYTLDLKQQMTNWVF